MCWSQAAAPPLVGGPYPAQVLKVKLLAVTSTAGPLGAPCPLPNLGAHHQSPGGSLWASSGWANMPYLESGSNYNNSTRFLRAPHMPNPKPGAQSHPPSLPAGWASQSPGHRRENKGILREEVWPAQSHRAGGRQSWANYTRYPGGPENGGVWRWELLVCWEVRKGGRLCWGCSWQHPKNHPALPPTAGPLHSPAPLVTLSLSPLSISQAVWTLGAPPCLSPLEGQGVGSPRRGAHELHKLWRGDFPGDTLSPLSRRTQTSQGVFPCQAPTVRPLREILDH